MQVKDIYVYYTTHTTVFAKNVSTFVTKNVQDFDHGHARGNPWKCPLLGE